MNKYFLELRTRLIKVMILLFVLFIYNFYYSDLIFYYFIKCITRFELPLHFDVIATELPAILTAPMKLSFYLALILVMPFAFFHFWKFISPALYQNEKKIIILFILISQLLFAFGIGFGCLFVAPLCIKFLLLWSTTATKIMADIMPLISFIFTISFALGIFFQIPLLMVLACRLSWFTITQYSKMRHFVLLIALIIGMFLTPPDIVSQIIFAIPIYILFELGIIFARLCSVHNKSLIKIKNPPV